MSDSPTLWQRLACLILGEVSAETLEAYRRASVPVFDLLERAERAREEAAADGQNAWTLPASRQAELACTWNAFVLQTLGNAFLDADYEQNPATRGFVPPITGDQILRFYTPVEAWLTRAQQAHADPGFRLDVPLPVALPAWSEVEPCPNSHLHGMVEAMQAIRDHAQAAMNFLECATGLTEEQQTQRGTIRGLFAAALSKADYAAGMYQRNPSRDIHERVEEHLKQVIEQLFLVGQLAAMPQRAVKTPVPSPAPAPTPAPHPRALKLPGEEGFDPWCLTDETARKTYWHDRDAHTSLERLWKIDPDPTRTILIREEINEAFTRGDIERAKDRFGKVIGYFFCSPWATIYSAVRPVTLGGVKIAPFQQFVYDVTAEGFYRGAPFRRAIKVGTFRLTDQFEYGDPNEEPDH